MPAALPTRTENHTAWTPFPLYFAGLLLFAAGPSIYAYQISSKSLIAPWYLPVLATAGMLFVLFALARRRSLPRLAAAAVLACVCAFEWFFLLVATKSPLYQGPAQIGVRVPAFQSSLADGSAFSAADLGKGTPTLLVFFRGRW